MNDWKREKDVERSVGRAGGVASSPAAASPKPQPTSPPMSVQQKSTVTAGPEFLSFQDAIIGVHTPTSSKMTSQKTDEVFDIHLLPCSCFSFMSIFNKQKLL